MFSKRWLVIVCALLAQSLSADELRPPKGVRVLGGWHGRDSSDPAALDKLADLPRQRTLDGWNAEARKHWKIGKDELVHDGQGVPLASSSTLGDVEIRLEFKLSPKARATMQLRGGRFQFAAPENRWTAAIVHLIGERVTIAVDGEPMRRHERLENAWDTKEPLPARGLLLLSASGGDVSWRNLFVRDIAADEANRLLQKPDSDAFKCVFNGKDFTGWDGPLDNYEVKEGAIVCKPKKGGNIFTKEQYDDFVARVEFHLPAGGNNGLAIRYPGKGQASVVAMCEVQVLDDTSAKYKKLDPRQYNGSVYGMIAAKRGYLRPLEAWNFMEVTVKGHAIRIELNGTRIVDGDVSKVTEFMGGKPHPGKDRLSGHFGFCGHSDPVAFRHVQIKPLPKKSEN